MNITSEDLAVYNMSQLFTGLSRIQLEDILDTLKAVVIKKDAKELLFSQGQQLNHIGCILEGHILVSSYDAGGNELLMGKLAPGYTIGANIAFTSTQISPYSFYCTKQTRLCLFPAKNSDLLPEYFINTYYRRILNLLANESVRQQYKIDILSQKSARSRILSYLKTQQRKRGSNKFSIPYNRDEMARYLCLNRSVLSHELSIMQNEGLISFKNNHFKILC